MVHDGISTCVSSQCIGSIGKLEKKSIVMKTSFVRVHETDINQFVKMKKNDRRERKGKFSKHFLGGKDGEIFPKETSAFCFVIINLLCFYFRSEFPINNICLRNTNTRPEICFTTAASLFLINHSFRSFLSSLLIHR